METQQQRLQRLRQEMSSSSAAAPSAQGPSSLPAGSAEDPNARVQRLRQEVTAGSKGPGLLVSQNTGGSKRSLGGFIKDDIAGRQTEDSRPKGLPGFVADIYQYTVGSKGASGLAQAPVLPYVQRETAKEKISIEENRKELADIADRYVAMASRETDLARKQKLLNLAQKTLQEGAKLEKEAKSVTDSITPSNSISGDLKRVSGQAINTALTFGPSLAAKPAEPIVRSTASRFGRAAAEGAGFGVGAALADEASAPEIISSGVLGAGLGAAFPVAGALANKTRQAAGNFAEREINSLIKPLLKDLSYGKNPGRGVAREGIVANSFDDLIQKVSAKKRELGNIIGQTIESASRGAKNKIATLDLRGVTKPITEAIEAAKRTPRTNKALIRRLQDALDDILGTKITKNGNTIFTRKLNRLTPQEAFEIKQIIADITKFTGNASDDGLVNRALRKAYGQIKEALNESVPGLKDLNERYADIVSADIATRYRDKIIERQNIIGLKSTTAGVGGAIITAVATGGAAVPSILAGLGAAGLQKALGSTVVKTSVASLLIKLAPAERNALFEAIPALREAILKIPVLRNIIEVEPGASTPVRNTFAKASGAANNAGFASGKTIAIGAGAGLGLATLPILAELASLNSKQSEQETIIQMVAAGRSQEILDTINALPPGSVERVKLEELYQRALGSVLENRNAER